MLHTKSFLLLIYAFFLVLSCSPPQKLVKANNPTPTEIADGLSYEKAIVITEKTETKGVQAEYKWLATNYPGYKFVSQKLMTYSEKPYDLITIRTRKGTTQEVYFEISNFAGKF